MRPLYHISLLAVSTLLVLKALKKLEEMNANVRSAPPIKPTEQLISRPSRSFKIILWNFLFVNGDDLSSFGIKSYKIIRAIHDETQTNNHREKRSIIKDKPHRILTLELDH